MLLFDKQRDEMEAAMLEKSNHWAKNNFFCGLPNFNFANKGKRGAISRGCKICFISKNREMAPVFNHPTPHAMRVSRIFLTTVMTKTKFQEVLKKLLRRKVTTTENENLWIE